MIKTDKDLHLPPKSLTSKSCEESLQAVLKEHDVKDHIGSFYRSDSVKEALLKLYHHKCGYCESNSNHAATLQVDHYRPKSGVKEDADHKGYYWLIYEWSNLILSCQKCNLSKKHHFPISGRRIIEPPAKDQWAVNSQPHQLEQPDLINPEIDRPEEYFRYSSDGILFSKNSNQRAEKTITILKLNRKDLLWARQRKIKRFRTQFNQGIIVIEKLIESGKIDNPVDFHNVLKIVFVDLFSSLRRTAEKDVEYSLLGQNMVDHFEEFFIAELQNDWHRKILAKAHELAFADHRETT